MPDAASTCPPPSASACTFAAPRWTRSARSTRSRSAAAMARRTISACAQRSTAGGIVLACDTFVYHEGSVSFGAGAKEQAALGMDMLTTRYPGYARIDRPPRQRRRGRPVPLRRHRGVVSADAPARRADAVARTGRRRAAAHRRADASACAAAPMCCCWRRRRAASRCRCRRCTAGPCWTCRASASRSSRGSCNPPRCRACTCTT